MSSFTPPWWCRGPHAQTLWGKLFRRRRELPARRVRWETPDGDFLDLYRLRAAKAAPRLLLLHGLEGTARSHYAAGMMHEARLRGWGADLMIFRSCGGELNRARRFYHSGETGDLAFAVDRIVRENPADPIFLAGVSLGGNVLLKWLGENGSHLPSQVVAAAAVSVPYDLGRSSDYINQGFARVYQAHFLRSLRRKALEKVATFPDLAPAGALAAIRTMRDFDNVFTAPVHGFRNANDYYERSSSIHFIERIRLPTLLLSAFDDPFLPAEVLGEVQRIAARTPALELEFVPRGGHVGFVQGRWPWAAVYHAERRVSDFFQTQLEVSANANNGETPG